jgi:hypothetical protein
MMEAIIEDEYDELAQTVALSDTDVLTGVQLYLERKGSPSGTMTLRIETVDGSNNPAGTLAHASAEATYEEDDLQIAGYAQIFFEFPAPLSVSSSGTFAIVLKTSRAASSTNYVRWATDSSSPSYASGEAKSKTGGVWANRARDFIFKVTKRGAVWKKIHTPLLTQPHGVSVKRTTSQSIPTSTNTYIVFDEAEFITNNGFWSAEDGDVVTVPEGLGGLYEIHGHIEWNTNSTVSRREARIVLNGTTVIAEETRVNPGYSLVKYTCNPQRVYVLNDLDTIQLRVWHDTGAALSVLAADDYSPILTLTRIGDAP